MTQVDLWKRYQRYLCDYPSIGLRLDVSRMTFDEVFFQQMREPMVEALASMSRLERGDIANPDENRMVGHYWLRAPTLTPNQVIRSDIERTIAEIQSFASDVHTGRVKPQKAEGFFIVLLVGIGGSALGPQFLSDALGRDDDPLLLRFIDNTDPDGIDRVIADLGELLPQTLTIVASKSGTTPETRNAMLEVRAAYERMGLSFAKHAVAITQPDSELDLTADKEKWLRTFPVWDWVGGRTSVTSAIGLLPAALQGIYIDEFLAGARDCDEVTRETDFRRNPAALLALAWHHAGGGRGTRNMVMLPYRDRLGLLGKFLQQLVMESVGKKKDRKGQLVSQGLTVYGNKGTSDQHSILQQQVEGPDDFFATFIEVRSDREEAPALQQEAGVTAADYLSAALHATRDVLTGQGRQSITITLEELNARTLGVLIALYERAVGLYAELIDVNAYHQPGVQAGKAAALRILDLQRRVLAFLREDAATPNGNGAGHGPWTAEEIAAHLDEKECVESVFHILEHLSAGPDNGIVRISGTTAFDARYGVVA